MQHWSQKKPANKKEDESTTADDVPDVIITEPGQKQRNFDACNPRIAEAKLDEATLVSTTTKFLFDGLLMPQMKSFPVEARPGFLLKFSAALIQRVTPELLQK